MDKTLEAPFAPEGLEFVRGFVNTLDVEAGTDALATPAGWQEWATSRGQGGGVTAGELEKLRQLREVIRRQLLAHHDRSVAPDDVAVGEMQRLLEWSGAVPRLQASGLELEPVGYGARRCAGAVLGAVARAMADGTWRRLKACRSDACQWAFYDHSRSRTGQWCSMGICGNRAKQARWRQKLG